MVGKLNWINMMAILRYGNHMELDGLQPYLNVVWGFKLGSRVVPNRFKTLNRLNIKMFKHVNKSDPYYV